MRAMIMVTVVGVCVVGLLGFALAQGTQSGTQPPGSALQSGQQFSLIPAMQQMIQACVQLMGQMMGATIPAPAVQPPTTQ